jgi:hypothetical protein
VRRTIVNLKSASVAAILSVAGLLLCCPLHSYAADNAVQVELDVKKAAPRAVEDLTERSILRDYRFAWLTMSRALEFNSPDFLEGAFAGDVKGMLTQTVASQQLRSKPSRGSRILRPGGRCHGVARYCRVSTPAIGRG